MATFLILIFLSSGFQNLTQTVNDSTKVLQVSTASSDSETILFTQAEWKFHPGDNLDWADPAYDDTDWQKVHPFYFDPQENSEILWQGVGWWRTSVQMDSSFYENNWYLLFRTMGAAEVYIDGERIKSYGRISSNPDSVITSNFTKEQYFPIQLDSKKTHTIAIRYANHQLEHLVPFIKSEFINYGFHIGVAKESAKQNFLDVLSYRKMTSSFSSGVLLVLLLLHLTLFFKYREDRSNLMISLLLAIYLIVIYLSFFDTLFKPSLLQYQIYQPFFIIFVPLVFLFLPYVLKTIFKLDGYEKVKHLIWLTPIPVLFYLAYGLFDKITSDFSAIAISLLSFLSLGFVGVIIYKVLKEKKPGAKYVATGAVTMMLSGILWTFFNLGLISLTYFAEYVLVTIILTCFPISLTLYIGNRYGHLYGSLEAEVKERTRALEKAYSELQESMEKLQTTQEQLVQQEKLASLGQLTAGIAHEIKNPLNFVNNFSELSVELVEESKEDLSVLSRQLSAKEEREKVDEALAILDDIEGNLRKINEHGSRADGIVKSMLEHSRGGSGKMEPTDLNELAKEYVNLSFHGMRASENPINVDIELELDEKVGEVPLIAEDFSRVIVNLCNNAFDAMREKLSKKAKVKGEKYVPKLTVRTKKAEDSVTIEVEDNGPGIPEEMKDKILQPFFTTKKGTEGTGLGLSITHDIVKAHGGDIEIHSKESGTVFSVKLNN